MSVETQSVGHHGRGLPESPGVDGRRLTTAAAAALLLLALGIGGLSAIYWQAVPVKTLPPPQTFPQPRVQPDEPTELRQILARQRRRLAGYRWANKEHTLVQIPIGRAMQIVAGEGPHAYDPITPAPAALASPSAGAERALTPSTAPPQQQTNPPPASSQGRSP